MLSLARHRLVNAGGGGLPFLRSFSRTTTSSRASTFSTLDKNRISVASPPLALSFPLRSDGRFLQHDRASGQFVFCVSSALVLDVGLSCAQTSILPSRPQPDQWATVLLKGTVVPFACLSSFGVLVCDVLLVH